MGAVDKIECVCSRQRQPHKRHKVSPPTCTSCKPSGPSSLGALIRLSLLLLLLLHAAHRSYAAPVSAETERESDTLDQMQNSRSLLHELAHYAEAEEDDLAMAAAYLRRLHKRLSAAEHNLEWQKSCGTWDTEVRHPTRNDLKWFMKDLRKAVRLEFKLVKTNLHDISVDDMKDWRFHERRYNFLPTLERNEKIAPMCWQQGLQKFVASFEYMYKQQEQWDEHNLQHSSAAARELDSLLHSARRIQCEIETAIHGTFPHNKRHITKMSRDDMSRVLNFYTKPGSNHVNAIDLRFLKFYYQNYLLRMWKLMPRRTENIQLQYDCSNTALKALLLDRSTDSESDIWNSEGDSSAEANAEDY